MLCLGELLYQEDQFHQAIADESCLEVEFGLVTWSIILSEYGTGGIFYYIDSRVVIRKRIEE